MADILTRLLLNTNDFDAKLSKSGKGVAEMEGKFSSVGKTAVAGFGAIAGAVGIAYGGIETFNKIVNSSNDMTDRWEAVCRSARSSVDEFFYSLTSGDFTFFNSGLDAIIAKAQAAAGAIDQLGNTTMSYNYFNTQNQADFAEAITVLRDKNASADDRAAAKATVEQVMGDQAEITAQLGRRTTETLQALVTESNSLKAGSVGLFDIGKIIRLDVSAMGDAEKGELSRQYEEYKSIAQKIRAEHTTEIKGGGMFGVGSEFRTDTDAYNQAMDAVNARFQDAILYNTILVKGSDEWLRNLIGIKAVWDNAVRVQAGMGKTANKTLQGVSGIGGGGRVAGKTTEKEYAEGSLGWLDKEIRKASEAVSSATTSEARAAAQKVVEELNAQKISMTAELKIETKPVEGSIDFINEQIKKLQTNFASAATSELRAGIAGQIAELSALKSQFESDGAAAPAEGSIDFINAKISEAQSVMSSATTDAARFAAQQLIDELENQKIILTIEAKHGSIDKMTMDQKIKLNVPTPDVEAYKESLVNADKAQKRLQTSAGKTSSGIGAFGNMMSSVASLTDQDSAQWLEWGANVASAIASAIPQIVMLTTTRKAEATANTEAAVSGAAASVASIPVVGWIMAGAAVASVIAAIASAPKFADGGVVGGSSYFGDKILARLNSGEMILNGDQQGTLYGMLNNGGARNINVTGTFRMRGRDMVAMIEKENRIKERT